MGILRSQGPLGGVQSLHRVTLPPNQIERLQRQAELEAHKFCTICGNRLQKTIVNMKYDAETGEENPEYEMICPQYDKDASEQGDRFNKGWRHDVVRF